MSLQRGGFAIFFFFLFLGKTFAAPPFFYMGSGEIDLKNLNTGAGIKIRYREGENQYNETALKKINQVYGSPYEDPMNRMSLRFLELLSYLQQNFNGAQIQILSGYRNPNLNQSLRDKGKLAAISSMHMESAAADIKIKDTDILQVRDFLMNLPCCGVGYYHGRHVHIDTGPKRWWDEKTSGTEKKEPQENEKIVLLTKKDIYSPQEKIDFDFARVSDYPIGVPAKMSLERLEKDQWKKVGEFVFLGKSDRLVDRLQPIAPINDNSCQILSERKQIKNLSLAPSTNLIPGRYRIGLSFCQKQWAKMPDAITSNEFEIRSTGFGFAPN